MGIELEALAVIFVVLVFVFQVIIPAIRRESLFPIFRRSDNIDKKIDEARRAKERAEKEAELASLEVETAKILKHSREVQGSIGNETEPKATETAKPDTTTKPDTGDTANVDQKHN
jgi:low affinity Fe/Cu permease